MKKMFYAVFWFACVVDALHGIVIGACNSSSKIIREAAYTASYDYTMMRKEV